MIGEYLAGEASIENDGISAATLLPEDAGLMTHFPEAHAQLPAPQSSGPLQTAEHMTPAQSGASVFSVQLVAWQHCAGTQSSSVLQIPASGAGVAVTSVVADTVGSGVGAEVWVAVVAGEGVPVHPAAAMNTITSMRRATIRSSIYCITPYRKINTAVCPDMKFKKKEGA